MSELSGSKSSGSLPAPSAVVASLRTEIKHMETRFAELRAAQIAARRQGIITVIVIIVIMLAFFGAGFYKLKQNFTEEEVRKAMAGPAFDLRVAATNKAIEVVQKVAPVYQAALMERIKKNGPKLTENAMVEFKKMPDEVGRMMLDEMGQVFARVTKRTEADLKVTFPELTNGSVEEKMQLLTAKIDKQTDVIKKDFNDRIVAEANKMQSILIKFGMPPEANDPKTQMWDLQRQFLHTLVMMVDYEILQTKDTEPSLAPVGATVK